METNIIELLFPEGLLEYFEVTDYKKTSQKIHFYLKEKNIIPEEYQIGELLSNGFYAEVIIEDFPLRAQQVDLHIKRRRWIEKVSKTTVSRDWKLVAKGTRMTQEFASFLKDISR
jgi:hypothetical protein